MIWREESLFFNSNKFFESFIEDCKNATKSIYIEVFIFEDGILLKKIMDQLNECANREVKVYIVIDGYGSGVSKSFFKKHPNINFRLFKPLWSQLLFLKQLNHRKMYIVDESIAYVGSSNIHDNTLYWRESGVRVVGHGVSYLVKSFFQSWNRSSGSSIIDKIKSKTDRFFVSFNKMISKGVILTDSSFDRIKTQYYWFRKIHKAKKRILITTPYFIPTTSIFAEILRASKRGVNIKVLLPTKEKIDLSFIKNIERYYVERMIKEGIEVYEYLPSMLHSKMSVFDNEIIVGSSNWNHRSKVLDLEVDISLHKKDSLSSIEAQIERDLSSSQRLTLDSLIKPNFFKRLYYNALMMIKHLS